MEKRGKKYLEAVYHPSLPNGRARRTFDSAEEAKAWKLDSKARLARGEPIDMGEVSRRTDGLPYTLQELRDYTFDTRWKVMRGAKTHAINSQSIVATIGPSMPVSRVTRKHIEDARKKLLEGGNSTVTINKKVSTLSVMMETAVGLGVITEPPSFPKQYEEKEGKESRFTDQHEALALRYFEAMGNQLMQDYIVFSLETGLRQGEVLLITSNEIRENAVTVWGKWAKAGKTRTVPLSARAREVVERRIADLGGERWPLFGRPPGTTRGLTKGSIRHYWNSMKAELGWLDDDELTPHLMRHEFCSRLADRGVSAPTIMALAGHASLNTSQRYIRVNGATLQAAINGTRVSPQDPLVQRLLDMLVAKGVDVSSLPLNDLAAAR